MNSAVSDPGYLVNRGHLLVFSYQLYVLESTIFLPPATGVGEELYSEVHCIMGNGHMGPLRWTDTTENITFPQLPCRGPSEICRTYRNGQKKGEKRSFFPLFSLVNLK